MESRCSWRLISEPIHLPVQNLYIESTSKSDFSSRGARSKGLVGCVRYKSTSGSSEQHTFDTPAINESAIFKTTKQNKIRIRGDCSNGWEFEGDFEFYCKHAIE